MIRSVVIALATAAVGVVPTMADVLAQVADNSSDVGPWVQAGGITAAMAALGYIAKRFADGSIVSLQVSEIIHAGAKREEALAEMVADARDREDAYRALLLSKGLHG
jgi:hypothetical protein